MQLLDENARVAVALDGRACIGWQGPQASLAIPRRWRMPNRRCLGLGAQKSDVVFRRGWVRMLSGKVSRHR